jgi:hypothetical protein
MSPLGVAGASRFGLKAIARGVSTQVAAPPELARRRVTMSH